MAETRPFNNQQVQSQTRNQMRLFAFLQVLNQSSEIVHLDSLTQPRHFTRARLRKSARDKTLENLIPFETLPEQYQISAAVLWDCLLALKFEPQELDGRIHFTAGNLKRLEQLVKRIEIAWACPRVLGTCGRAKRKTEASLML